MGWVAKFLLLKREKERGEGRKEGETEREEIMYDITLYRYL